MWREELDTERLRATYEHVSSSAHPTQGQVLAMGGGPGMQAAYLAPTLQPFVSRGYALHFVDWLRAPDSASRANGAEQRRPRPQDLGLWAQVAAVERFRQAVGAVRPWFVAHSAGVAVIVGYALRYPERVGGLVLFDGAARALMPPSGVIPILIRIQLARLTRHISTEEAFLRIYPQASLPLYFSAAWLHQAPSHAATAVDEIRRSFTPPFWHVLTAPVMNHDFRGQLRQLRPARNRQKQPANPLAQVPALVIRGAQDFIIPQAATRELFEELKRAQLASHWATIPGAGHYPMIEQPAASAEAVSAFLDAAQHARA